MDEKRHVGVSDDVSSFAGGGVRGHDNDGNRGIW